MDADGEMQFEVKLEQETLWLTREQMAILFDLDYKTIAKHVNNGLKEELQGDPVGAKFATHKKSGRGGTDHRPCLPHRAAQQRAGASLHHTAHL